MGRVGITIFRILYIRHENGVKYIIGEKLILWIILRSGAAYTGLIMNIYMNEDNRDKPGMNIRTGLSTSHTLV